MELNSEVLEGSGKTSRKIQTTKEENATNTDEGKTPYEKLLSNINDRFVPFFNKLLFNKIPIASINQKSFTATAIKDIKHHIHTKGQPCMAKARRLRPELLKEFDSELNRMLEMGVLIPSDSQWASTLHMQKKADGTWRPCGDFRALNAITEKDAYPVPNVMDVTANLQGMSVFSKIDLFRGYWQIKVDDADVHKTAIITPRGLFAFRRTPFGLKNAPSMFQRAMDSMLRGLKHVFCYIDDILVASPCPEEHADDLEKLFDRLQNNGVVVALNKCAFFQTRVNFLGFTITGDGTTIPEERVEAIRKLQIPATPKLLYALLGHLGYYRLFVKNFAQVTRALYQVADHNVTKKQVWNDQVLQGFENTKRAIAAATI